MGGRYVIVVLLGAFLLAACGRATPGPLETPTAEDSPTRAPRPSPTSLRSLRFDVNGFNVYEDAVGSLRFLFQVTNANDFAVEDVSARVILSDAEGQVVASHSGYVKLDVLGPGETAPVIVVFFLLAPDFATYEVEIGAREADYLRTLLHPRLQIVDHIGRVGEWVPYEVLGKVVNLGEWDAEAVTLVVTCYDSHGRIVAVGTGAPQERTIQVGGSSDFLVSIGAVYGEIATYRAQVQALAAKYD